MNFLDWLRREIFENGRFLKMRNFLKMGDFLEMGDFFENGRFWEIVEENGKK